MTFRNRNWLRATAATALMTVLLPLTGCMRLHTELTADRNDRVSGNVIVATPKKAHPKIVDWQIPSTLDDKITASDYDQDGYIGKKFTLDDLSFEEFNSLIDSISDEAGTNIHFERTSANTMELNGMFDFTKVKADKADLALNVEFPGPLSATNGQQGSDTAAQWAGQPGKVLDVTAEAASTPDSRTKMQQWTFITMLVGLLTAAGVAVWTVRNSRMTHTKLVGRPATATQDPAEPLALPPGESTEEPKKPTVDDWAL
ncbi:LppM family (lipo)protein [Corynebacterium ulceribovis]|uniref:LppM family (lipo)protein n=1 Tax=Corynebacterium ulceribovis TaxID=487732 RepID=UPI000366DF54|nr:hypothetical protein [Corynebacterium ulceribovis]